MASRVRSLLPSFSALAFLIVTTSASTFAYAAGSPTAAERETARRLMDDGKARMKDKDHQHAVESFQKAHDIMHVPTTGLALAKAHLAAGHLVEARDTALEVNRLPREAGEPRVFESARKEAKEIDAQLRPRIPTLRIKIKGSNVARVAIDDTEISPSIVGEPIAVNPGKHIVSAKNGEGGEAKGEVELSEREAKEIDLILPAHGGETPTVKPTSTSSSSTPSTSSTPSSSTSSTTTKVTGFGNDGPTDRGGGERTPLAQGLFFGGLGLGGAGLIVGGVAGLLTLSKAGDVESECLNDICSPAAKDNLDSASTLSTISTIGFIVGGVGVAALAISFAVPKEPSAKRRASSQPLTVKLGSGLSVGGTF